MKLVIHHDVKKILLLLGIICLPSLNSLASESQPHVTVYGTATTSVAIDEMNWRIRISNKEATLEEVAKVHNSTVQSVLNFLIDNELPEHCIQSSGMEFGENFVTSKLKGRVRSGYQASSSIKFKVTDLSKYKDLWSGISRMDNVSLNGISYDNSKRIKHRKDIRQKAVNVCVSQLYNIRVLEEHEHSKLATSLKKGCQTQHATTREERKGKQLAVSHTIEKRILDYPREGKSF